MIQYSNVYKTTPDAAAIGEFFDRQYKIQDSNFSIEKTHEEVNSARLRGGRRRKKRGDGGIALWLL